MTDDPSTEADTAPADSMDAVIAVYKRDVDRTLLLENLKLTVEERLLKAMRMHESVVAWREAGARQGTISGGETRHDRIAGRRGSNPQ